MKRKKRERKLARLGGGTTWNTGGLISLLRFPFPALFLQDKGAVFSYLGVRGMLKVEQLHESCKDTGRIVGRVPDG